MFILLQKLKTNLSTKNKKLIPELPESLNEKQIQIRRNKINEIC